jgi:hypothetical protein
MSIFVNQQWSLFIVESEDGHMHVVNGRTERKKQPWKALSMHLRRKTEEFHNNMSVWKGRATSEFRIHGLHWARQKRWRSTHLLGFSSLYLALQFIFLKPATNFGL